MPGLGVIPERGDLMAGEQTCDFRLENRTLHCTFAGRLGTNECPPLEEELEILGVPAEGGRSSRRVVYARDLAWALINSAEFLHRH